MIAAAAPVHAPGIAPRLRLLARSGVVLVTAAPIGALLFSLWLTAAVLAPLTLFVWALPPLTAVVRRYADLYRGDVGRVLGTPVRRPYRETSGSLFARVIATLRDPASWRDAAWLLVHSVVGTFFAALQVSLFLGGLFYLAFPFLYWITPQGVFGRPFGFYEIHSVGAAATLMPLAVVSFLLWYGLSVPLARGEARLTRGMLSA